MKKFLLSAFVVVAFLGYAINQRFDREDDDNDLPVNTLPGPSPTPAMMNVNNMGRMGTMMGSTYKNGQFTGTSVYAFYGYVQVAATIQGGKLTDVQFLKYPNDRRTSVEINTQAMPILKSEAIQAQSANVDIVTGATQTSNAFIKSLTSALEQAK